ncbi:MAG: hypothetical protein K2Y16_06640 [Burkholderiales bacterium]|nr:hypothetical protein [Burkholderiales bacterium]
MWFLAGSLTLRTDDERIVNRSFLTEIIYAGIDPARVAKVRGMIPSLEHDRPFQPPPAA